MQGFGVTSVQLCFGDPPGVCAVSSSPGWSSPGGTGQLCAHRVSSPSRTAQSRAQLGLQCQAELLLREQRCHSPCCSPKTVLQLQSPAAATERLPKPNSSHSCQDLGTDHNSGMPLWDVSGLGCKTLFLWGN